MANARIAFSFPSSGNLRATHGGAFDGFIQVLVQVDTGSGFVNAPAGTTVTLTLDSGPGSVLVSSAVTVGSSGLTPNTGGAFLQYARTATGSTASVFSAHTTVTVSGTPLTRSTDGTGSNGSPLSLGPVWDAKITITPTARSYSTPQIGTQTVTVYKDIGDGNGWVPWDTAHVSFTLTDFAPANSSLLAAHMTCDEAGTNVDAAGSCTIVYQDVGGAGTIQGHASVTSSFTVSGGGSTGTFTIQTDGITPNGADAIDTWTVGVAKPRQSIRRR